MYSLAFRLEKKGLLGKKVLIKDHVLMAIQKDSHAIACFKKIVRNFKNEYCDNAE